MSRAYAVCRLRQGGGTWHRTSSRDLLRIIPLLGVAVEVQGLEPQRLKSHPHGETQTTDMLGWHAHEKRHNKALRATEAT